MKTKIVVLHVNLLTEQLTEGQCYPYSQTCIKGLPQGSTLVAIDNSHLNKGILSLLYEHVSFPEVPENQAPDVIVPLYRCDFKIEDPPVQGPEDLGGGDGVSFPD